MTVRIYNQPIVGIQKAYNLPKNVDEPKRSDQKQRDDDIKLSPEARLWSAALEAARGLPERNEQKIEELKAAVENGRYRVNDEEIAEKIWQESVDTK